MTDDARDRPASTGLEPDGERLYRILLSKADASVPQLAAEAGMEPPRARKAVLDLVDTGFATMVADERYRAVAPDVVLGGRLTAQLNTVRTGYETLRELLEIHRTGPGLGGRDDRGRWEQVTGAVAIQSRLGRLEATADRCVRIFVKPPIVAPPLEGDRRREERDRAVERRLLYDRDVLDDDRQAACLRQALDRGDQVRFSKRLPLKMVVVDERTSLIEEPGSGRPKAVVTSNRSVVRLAVSLFEHLWDAAVPAPAGERGDPGIDEDDALLLSLLIAGLTDQSIASKLGIGLRTVQRRVRDLMDLAGVDTRIQLGWHAAKHGWVL